MKTKMKEFFSTMAERHRIYIRRFKKKKPKPWTKDPIFQTNKFCNVFRQLDKVTKHWRAFCKRHLDDGPGLIFNVAWYRIFNLPSTATYLGWIDDWDMEKTIEDLKNYQEAGNKVYNSAYIIRGTQGEKKYITYCKTFDMIWQWREGIYKTIKEANTIKSAVEAYSAFPFIAGFLAYEMATDLRHTPVLENAEDIMKYANIGPGCRRGLQRLYYEITPKKFNDDRYCRARMCRILDKAPEYLSEYKWMKNKQLEMRDIEHWLCEFDKYRRCKEGGRTKCKFNGV